MPRKYRRHFLKAKEAKSILNGASEKLKVDFKQIFKDKVDMELIETNFADILLVNHKPILVGIQGKIFPTLLFNEIFDLMPKAVVDMGAVPHVCNGANVMAPGIVRFEGEFKKGDLVLVVDEKHGKTIAIGEVAYNSDAAKKARQGTVVTNFHFIGDRIWSFLKKFK